MSITNSEGEVIDGQKKETVYSGMERAKELATQMQIKAWEKKLDELLLDQGITDDTWWLQGQIQKAKVQLEEAKLEAMYQVKKMERAKMKVNEWTCELKKLQEKMQKLLAKPPDSRILDGTE